MMVARYGQLALMDQGGEKPSVHALTWSFVKKLFEGGDPREIAERLYRGDPLRMEARCAHRARERYFLLNPDQLHRRSLAAVALAAPRFDGSGDLELWVRDRIDEAITSVIQQDRRDLEAGLVPSNPPEPRFEYLADALGLEPELTLQAAVAFNELPDYTRESFFHLIILARPLQDVLAEGYGPPDDLRLRIRTALAALTIITPDRIRL